MGKTKQAERLRQVVASANELPDKTRSHYMRVRRDLLVEVATKQAELSKIACESAQSRQLKRMSTQRHKFEAGVESERSVWISDLEGRVQSATQAVDADEVCKLMVQAVAWLRASCVRSSSCAQQERLCQLLLRMLRFLDLDDANTRGLVQYPCSQIIILIDGPVRFSGSV